MAASLGYPSPRERAAGPPAGSPERYATAEQQRSIALGAGLTETLITARGDFEAVLLTSNTGNVVFTLRDFIGRMVGEVSFQAAGQEFIRQRAARVDVFNPTAGAVNVGAAVFYL